MEEAKRETEINKVINRLDSIIGVVGGETEQMGIRLCNIMRGGIAENTKNANTPEVEFSVPLAQELNKFALRLSKR